MLEELRDIGLVGMIEEFTKRRILPLTRRNGEYIVRQPTEEELQGVLIRKYSPYRASVAFPKQAKDGHIEPDLRIEIERSDFAHTFYPLSLVNVTYGVGGILSISGAEETYSGNIASESNATEVMESSMAQALFNPKKVAKSPYR